MLDFTTLNSKGPWFTECSETENGDYDHMNSRIQMTDLSIFNTTEGATMINDSLPINTFVISGLKTIMYKNTSFVLTFVGK